jgi:hypothetical protein
MTFRDFHPRLLSPPVKIHWAGWESDTLRLSRSGWDISVEQDYYEDSLRFALRHKEARVYGISEPIPYREVAQAGLPPGKISEIISQMGVRVSLANEFQIIIQETMMPRFEPGDMTPSITERKIYHIEDLKIFKTRPPDAQEVLLDMPTIDEVLKYALKLQEPIQAELREKKRKAEALEKKAHMDSELKAELRLVA